MRVKIILSAAIIAGLLACGLAKQSEPAVDSVTLTPERREARLPFDRQVWQNSPPLLEVPVSRVKNPHLTGFAIFVYLAWTPDQPGPKARQKVSIGNFGVFPPDRPGRFTLRASQAFAEARKRGVTLRENRPELLFVMRKVRASEAWTPLEVTLGPVTWRRENQTEGKQQ